MKPHMLIAVLAPLCGSSIPMGFNLGVLNSPQKYIRKWMKQSIYEQYDKELSIHQEVILWAAVVSMFLVGAMIGSLSCSRIADKIGRKRTLLLSHVISIVASILFTGSVYIKRIEVFIVARFLSGICGGLASSIVPLYFSEVFPSQLKGVSGVIHVSGMTFGILLSIIVGTDTILGSEHHWRFMSAFTLAASSLALLLHPCILETPLYCLLKTNNFEKASKILKNIRSDQKDIAIELNQLRQFDIDLCSEHSGMKRMNIITMAKSKGSRILFLNVVILFGIQQFSGINGCWFYSNMIFSLAGLNPIMSSLASVFASSTNWLMGFVSFFFIRKYPRRILLMTSIIGCALSLSAMAISLHFAKEHLVYPYITMLSFILFIIFFGFGVGTLPFILTVEMMPEDYRSFALSLGASTMWTCNLIVSLTLPLLNHYMGPFLFLIFASLLIFSGVYFYFFIPETFNMGKFDEGKESKIITISSNVLDANLRL